MPYKKIFYLTSILLLLITINNLIHSIYSTYQKQDLIVQAQKQLDREKEKNQELKKELAQVKKPEFIETEARDKLLLAKKNEGIIVIPTGTIIVSPSAHPPPPDKRPNWQKWWEVFF